jgi:beta-RFAP synthase
MTVRVVAPCRLHFGLLHVPVPGVAEGPRFGGVGLMIDGPTVTVTARPAETISAHGVLSARGSDVLTRVHQQLSNREVRPTQLEADGPPEHVGLGVGTALSLAVARAVAGPRPVAELAALTGRGERSGIGLHGFDRGGFLLDAGKTANGELPALHTRLEFPDDWRIVLLRPAVEVTWAGDRERSAFDRPRDPATAQASTDRMKAVVFDDLVPAVAARDFATFADAVHRYNRLAGEPFAADQGGPYAGPEVTAVIESLLSWGVAGVGQSSWGPTVFAFVRDDDEAHQLAGRANRHFPNLADVTISRANNRGHSWTRIATDEE